MDTGTGTSIILEHIQYRMIPVLEQTAALSPMLTHSPHYNRLGKAEESEAEANNRYDTSHPVKGHLSQYVIHRVCDHHAPPKPNQNVPLNNPPTAVADCTRRLTEKTKLKP